jgi:hypothetical protein
MATKRTKAELVARYLSTDPNDFIADLVESLQHEDEAFAGEVRQTVQTLTASGAITINNGTVLLNHASTIIAATLDAPTAGDRLTIVDSSASGTAAHTVTLPAGVTFDGTNNTATLNAPGESLEILALSATRWFILENIGAVALSNV